MLELPPTPIDDVPVEYRILTPEEIKQIEPVFKAQGSPLPDPGLSTFVGAILAGKVIGFAVLQLRLHAGPWWVEEGYSAIFKPLAMAAERTILERTGPQWVFLFTADERLIKLAQAMGMKADPGAQVLTKLVAPEIPVRVPLDLGPLPIADIQPETIQ